MKKLFVITGEHSGDIHAGRVVEILKSQHPEIEVHGIGGENLKNAGATIFCDHTKMSGFGLSLQMIIDHIKLENDLCEYILDEYKPDLVLLIDYGTFNLRVAKRLKGKGIKILHYIPPQVWASRKWRIKKIKKFVDKVLCIFPFEVEMYKKEGIDVHYCGHPLVKQLPEKANKEEFFKKHELDINRPLVSIFPGSRPLELAYLAKTFIKAAKALQKKHPEIQFCISHAPNLKDKIFDKYIKDVDIKIIKGENHSLLSVSDSLILASGTVALEATLYETPMLIGYKGPWLLYIVYLLVRCMDKVSLPNIVSGKSIIAELVQHRFNVPNIVYETEKILYDSQYRNNMIKNLSGVKELLSEKYSAQEVAECINNFL
jgi:lipid-A-disaccharide synthase